MNGVFFPALALAHECAALFGRRRHAVAFRQVAAPAALLLAAMLWALLQMSTLLPEAVMHPVWSVAGKNLDQPVFESISVNRTETAFALIRLLTAASVFWVALQLSRNADRAYALLAAIAVIVAAYAACGLALWFFAEGDIPFIDAPPAQGGVRATFVNRNHFATYAGLGLIVSMGLALRRFNHARRDWRGFVAAALRGLPWIATGAVALAALLGSVSRGGVVATLIGAALLLMLGRGKAGGRVSAGPLIVAAALALGVAIFSGALLTRVSAVGLDGAARVATYQIVIGSILDNPLTGLGYGAFVDSFPMYRDQSIPTSGLWDKAHNTYLEVWQGLGLVFGSALIASVTLLAIRCVRGARRRHRNATPSAIAAASAALIGVHALVDFSVQIEAVALTFMAILGAGVAQAESSRAAIGD